VARLSLALRSEIVIVLELGKSKRGQSMGQSTILDKGRTLRGARFTRCTTIGGYHWQPPESAFKGGGRWSLSGASAESSSLPR
jgi:hypothetical protein